MRASKSIRNGSNPIRASKSIRHCVPMRSSKGITHCVPMMSSKSIRNGSNPIRASNSITDGGDPLGHLEVLDMVVAHFGM